MMWRLALAPFLAAAIVVVAAAGCARDEPADPPTPKAPATPVDPAAPTGTVAQPQAPKGSPAGGDRGAGAVSLCAATAHARSHSQSGHMP